MPVLAGYAMGLRCMNDPMMCKKSTHVYIGETWSECKRTARKDGWVFRKDGEVVCPKCSGEDQVKRSPCSGCPFNDGVTEEAAIAQNYGCLPTASDMRERFDQTGVAHSCHEDDTTACRGLSQERNTDGVPVLAYSEWYNG